MSDSWNNVKSVCCKPWLVLPTVYSDALSYGEQLDKFCYSLNKVIENNNILPEYVAEKIKEYISSGAIGEVVREILANYILNVKYPPKGIAPAVGDGSADDTEAIQGCIDYAAKNGGVVYFPYGSYLTQPLTMKNGVSLFGFDRYSTKIVLKGGATKALLNGNGNNLSVCNLTLDGNSGIQVNDVNVVDMTGNNLMFNDLVIKDGYKLFNFVGDGHLQLSNIVFGNAVENCFTVDGNVIVQTNNLLFTALSKVGGVSVVDIRANGGNYDFNSVAKCDTCMLISGNDNKIVALIGGANEDYVDTGEHNNVEIVGHSQKEYYSGNVKKDANNSETTLQGTRSLHVVGANTVAYDSDSTESVDGNKSSIVTGTTTETYNGDRTITDNNKTETAKKKIVNATDIVLNPVNPLTYGSVVEGSPFNYINMKDKNNSPYKLLVPKGNIEDTLPFIDASKFGVLPNGEDMTETLNTLLDTYSDNYVVYLKRGTYTFNDTIKINKHGAHFKCDGQIKSNADIAVLLTASDCTIDIYNINGKHDGSGIGFQHGSSDMANTYGNSVISLQFVWGFNTGIRLYSNNENGIQNDILYLDRIDDCNIGIELACGNAGGNWVNQNTFYGGWIAGSTNRPNAKGIKFTKGANMTDRFNGNAFNFFSCEQTRYPIDIEFANNNVFNYFRLYENTGNDLIKCANDTNANKFIGLKNYVDYNAITDLGDMNAYEFTFASSGINICEHAYYYQGNFIPMKEYLMPTKYNFTQTATLPNTALAEYIEIDGSSYNVDLNLPIKYSFIRTANSFIVDIKGIAGITHVGLILYNGTVIATSENASGVSGVQLEANTKYLVIPVDNNFYKVVKLG